MALHRRFNYNLSCDVPKAGAWGQENLLRHRPAYFIGFLHNSFDKFRYRWNIMNYALDLTRQLNPFFGVAANGHLFYRFNGNEQNGQVS